MVISEVYLTQKPGEQDAETHTILKLTRAKSSQNFVLSVAKPAHVCPVARPVYLLFLGWGWGGWDFHLTLCETLRPVLISFSPYRILISASILGNAFTYLRIEGITKLEIAESDQKKIHKSKVSW